MSYTKLSFSECESMFRHEGAFRLYAEHRASEDSDCAEYEDYYFRRLKVPRLDQMLSLVHVNKQPYTRPCLFSSAPTASGADRSQTSQCSLKCCGRATRDTRPDALPSTPQSPAALKVSEMWASDWTQTAGTNRTVCAWPVPLKISYVCVGSSA